MSSYSSLPSPSERTTSTTLLLLIADFLHSEDYFPCNLMCVLANAHHLTLKHSGRLDELSGCFVVPNLMAAWPCSRLHVLTVGSRMLFEAFRSFIQCSPNLKTLNISSEVAHGFGAEEGYP